MTTTEKMDGFINVLTGMGTKKDKNIYNGYQLGRILTWSELSMMYATGGLFSTIVDVVADDSTRQGWYINNDEDNKITNKMKELNVQSCMSDAFKWARLYGGSVVLLGVMDGLKLEEPINMKRIRDISYLHTFDRTSIQVLDSDIQKNPLLPGYMKAEYYTITPRTGTQFRVHCSRIVELKGELVPSELNVGEWYYFGMGIIQKAIDEIERLGITMSAIGTLMHEFVYGIYKFKGLADMLAEGNEDALKTRLKAVDMSKSIINSVVLDMDEDFIRSTLSFTGIPEIIDRFMMGVSSVTGIPVTKLFGRSAAGMNATGEGDLDNYYDMIKAEQEQKLQSGLQYIIDIINLNTKISEPTIIFNSLRQKTDKQELEEQMIQAEIDKIYIESGVLSSEEVTINRFTPGGFSYETKI